MQENLMEYQRHIQQWKAERLSNLTKPNGWLNLSAFAWLNIGDNHIGNAVDNNIIVKSDIPYIGVITLTLDGKLTFKAAPKSTIMIDEVHQNEAELFDDTHASQETTIVSFGTSKLHIINREGRRAIRVKDDFAFERTHFSKLDYFDIDLSWRVEANWTPFHVPCELKLHRRLGSKSIVNAQGLTTFQRPGGLHSLLLFREKPDTNLFIVMADNTSGKQTYKNARFLYVDEPENGKLILDFNKAHNPPSAFTPYANCPIAPVENRLDLHINAGEMDYCGPKKSI